MFPIVLCQIKALWEELAGLKGEEFFFLFSRK